jgi:hypothetical protein
MQYMSCPKHLENDMDFSQWSVEELEALGMVYLKHKQLQKAQTLRSELERRLELIENANLRSLADRLDCKNVASLSDIIFARLKRLA